MNHISSATEKRLPMYLSFLRSLPEGSPQNISSTAIAAVFGLNDVQVRKDLAAVCEGGKPRTGYITKDLVQNIEECLGFSNLSDAVLVGAGNLGRALLSYDGFAERGMNIVTAFDKNEELIGTQVNGKHILSAERIEELTARMSIRIGIIAVPSTEAQGVADSLVRAGVLAIWNFSRAAITVPANVAVLNERIGSGLTEMLARLRPSPE